MKALIHSALLFVLATAVPAGAATSIADGIVRTRVAGVDVVAKPTAVEDVITITGSIAAGTALNPPGNPSIALLTAGMLDRGTVKRDKFAIAKTLEDSAASLGFLTVNTGVMVYGRCLKKDLPMLMALLAEELRSPRFAAEELEKLKKEQIGEIRQRREDPEAHAWEAFRQTIYPAGHANRVALDKDQIAGIEAAQVQDLKAFHSAHYGPAQIKLVVVGDVDVKKLHAALQAGFGGWESGKAPASLPSVKAQPFPSAPEQTIVVPGKTSAVLYIGQATGLKYRDPDALALRVGTIVLGSGFTGRLMHNVRDKEGLTYGIRSFIGNDNAVDGDFRISGTFAPALLERGVVSTQRQLNEWYEKGITAAELAQRQKQMVGSYYVSLEDTDGLANTILSALERGYDLSWLDEYPRAVKALTVEQVNRAIRTHLDPRKMVVIRAGSVESKS